VTDEAIALGEGLRLGGSAGIMEVDGSPAAASGTCPLSQRLREETGI